MQVRATIQEFADALRFPLAPTDMGRVLLNEGRRVWEVSERAAIRLRAYGATPTDAFAVAGERAWLGHQPDGLSSPWEIASLLVPKEGAPTAMASRCTNVSLAFGVQCASGARALACRTEGRKQLDLGVVDLERGTFDGRLSLPKRYTSAQGIVAACTQAGSVAVLDEAFVLRFERELGPDIESVRIVASTSRVFVYAIAAARRVLLDAVDGSTVWSRDVKDLVVLGGSPGTVWEADVNTGEVIGRDVETGEERERWSAGVQKNTFWRVTEWAGNVVEIADPLGGIRLREPGSGKVLQVLELPGPLTPWAYFEPMRVYDSLVVALMDQRDGYRGSLYGLLFLSTNSSVPEGVSVEPRPPHQFEKVAGAKGGHGYRIAIRCASEDDLLRIGLVLVKHLAYEKGTSPTKKGERGFDGTIEFAFDRTGLSAESSARVERWAGLWNDELKHMVSAPKGGKHMNVRLVPFAPEMLQGA